MAPRQGLCALHPTSGTPQHPCPSPWPCTLGPQLPTSQGSSGRNGGSTALNPGSPHGRPPAPAAEESGPPAGPPCPRPFGRRLTWPSRGTDTHTRRQALETGAPSQPSGPGRASGQRVAWGVVTTPLRHTPGRAPRPHAPEPHTPGRCRRGGDPRPARALSPSSLSGRDDACMPTVPDQRVPGRQNLCPQERQTGGRGPNPSRRVMSWIYRKGNTI